MTRPIPATTAFSGWLVGWLLGPAVVGAAVLELTGGSTAEFNVWRLAAVVTSGWIVLLIVAWQLSERFGSGSFVEDYGLRFRPIDAWGLPLGVALQMVAIPAVYWPLRTLWPDTFSNEELSERAKEIASGASGWRVLVLVAVVVIGAPLVEELMYRGLLQRSAAFAWTPAVAWIVVSSIFAVIHMSPVEIPGLFVAGLTFGAWPLVTGRIGGAIATHVGFNAAGVAIALTV